MINKENIVFVHVSPEDANMFHIYQTILHGESNIFFRTAKDIEELGTSNVKRYIIDSLKIPHSAIFILKDLNTKEIWGHVQIEVGQTSRSRHKAEIYLGVLNQFQGIGVGKKFLEIIDYWAKKEAIEIVQLTVFANNERAIDFYLNNGYIIEGTIKNAVRYEDGSYTDEVIMAKYMQQADSDENQLEEELLAVSNA